MTETEFLATYDAGAFQRMSVAVDVVVMTAKDGALRAVLVQRDEHPQQGAWALPGGFVGYHEELEDAARRVLLRETGLADVYLEQLYTFGGVHRDPRTRVVSVAWIALVPPSRLDDLGGGELVALSVPWEGETGGPVDAGRRVAFDHALVLGTAVQRLRGKLDYTNVGFAMLPPSFTLRRLQALHETVLGRSLNKDSFRRRMLASGLVAPTGETEADVGHRPAALYRFTGATAPSEGRR